MFSYTHLRAPACGCPLSTSYPVPLRRSRSTTTRRCRRTRCRGRRPRRPDGSASVSPLRSTDGTFRGSRLLLLQHFLPSLLLLLLLLLLLPISSVVVFLWLVHGDARPLPWTPRRPTLFPRALAYGPLLRLLLKASDRGESSLEIHSTVGIATTAGPTSIVTAAVSRSTLGTSSTVFPAVE